MGFKFVYLCDLLSSLEALSTRDPPLLPTVLRERYQKAITQWFRSHRARVDALDAPSAVALLSALFPERRTDRVYNLQPNSLTRVLGRCLLLGITRSKELERWKEPGRGDLGACVERVQREAEMPRCSEAEEVTIEEVDSALAALAGKCRFSGPKVREQHQPLGQHQTRPEASKIHEVLGNVYTRLQSREAKWFTRILLKNYAPVVLPEGLTLRLFNFLLPGFLKVQDSFEAAIAMLKGPVVGGWRAMPGSEAVMRYCNKAAQFLVPMMGVKVGRTTYLKARSIKHALQMAGMRRMSLERKYDGEYCQVHINLSKGENCIQIFSKSGKDSTLDKEKVHGTIRKALRIGTPNCAINRNCVLEGELLVWSDKEQKVLEFHKLRKHLTRSGVFLGTSKDSQAHDYEHLMLIFYDLLFMNDDPILTKPHRERRRTLEGLITSIPGRAEVVTREEIHFSAPDGSTRLRKALAHALTQRWEGYVLKPSDEPYFNLGPQPTGNYGSAWIKLKKDYIKGLGDTADFAVVGGGYDAAEAIRLGLKNLSWTHFHIGCLQNKADVIRFQAKPEFTVVDAFNQSIQRHDMETLNQLGKFRASKLGTPEAREAFDLKMEPGLNCKMDVVFREPFVFEVLGSGFDKPANRDYFVLRFPRVLKIHWDRDFKDSTSFDELQEMAHEARKAPVEHPSQEDAAWIARLEQADRGKDGTIADWEDSQDLLGGSVQVSPIRSSRTPTRRIHTATSAPMIRMDTQEMLPTERRLDTGEVSSQTTSPRSSMTVATSGSSLFTPPPSSPVETGKKTFKQLARPLDGTPATNPRKRASIALTPDNGFHPTKRYRALPPASLSKEQQRNALGRTSTVPGVAKASQHPRPSADAKAVEDNSRAPTSALSLVRKLAVGTEMGSYVRKQHKRAAPDSSSLRETTASEHSDTMTPLTPPTFLQLPQEEPLHTVPADLPALQPRPHTSRIPRLSECQVLLSPCVADMPYLTENLLPLYTTTHRLVSDYTSQTAAVSDNLPLTPPMSGNEVVVLVEGERAHATSGVLRSLSPIVKHEKKRFVFWDWRLLERLGTEDGRQKVYADCFVARMDWDEGRGAVVIRWLTGKCTKESGF